MFLNTGKFSDNGGAGYILKPDVMSRLKFSPFDKKTFNDQVKPIKLGVRVRLPLPCFDCSTLGRITRNTVSLRSSVLAIC